MTDPLEASSRHAREANLLGALALVLSDQIYAAASAGNASARNAIADTDSAPAVGADSAAVSTDELPVSDATALSALLHFLDRPTVDRLRRVLGLTHSGAVRLVDRLARSGLVTREPGADARSRAVALTPRGEAAAANVSAARADVLDGALNDLTEDERATLHALLGKVMGTIVRGREGDNAWICRLCDTRACGRPQGLCPAATAAAEKYGFTLG